MDIIGNIFLVSLLSTIGSLALQAPRCQDRSKSLLIIIMLSQLLTLSRRLILVHFCTGINFTEEPRNIVITGCGNASGTHGVASFSCRYEGSSAAPQWVINSTVYDSLNQHLPPNHYYSNHQLLVRSPIQYNNTEYRCQIFAITNEGTLCVYASGTGRLIVKCYKCKFHCQSFVQ